MPPITTVASGLCTSAPVPVFSAMGRKPKLATSAIINTGRSFVNVPFNDGLINSHSLRPQVADARHDHQTFEYRHAREGNEADPGRDGQRYIA